MTFETVDCAVCGGSDHAPLYAVRNTHISDETFQLVRCRGCGLIFVNPRPADVAPYYEKTYHAYTYTRPGPFLQGGIKGAAKRAILSRQYGYPYTVSPLWTLLAPLLRLQSHRIAYFPRYVAGGSLLEVGCATGELLSVLRELGWRVRGVDFSPDASRFAREKLDLDVFTGSVEDAGLSDAAFDAVIMQHVLEHLPRPGRALAEIRRLLKPGGDLYIGVPSVRCLEWRLFGKYWDWEAPWHLHHFTPAALERLLAAQGFRIASVRHELFGNGMDFAMAWRNVLREWGLGEALHRPGPANALARLYAPLGTPLAALGLGSRIVVHARRD